MSLKLVEVLVLVCAGVLFVWWQMRDLRSAREQTRMQRQAEQAARAVLGTGTQNLDAPVASPAQQPSGNRSTNADGSPHAP